MNNSFLRRLILQSTKLTRQHLTPELQLHLITPECHLWSANAADSPFEDPFWAFYWPGGQALTRFIFDNPGKFEGKTVLDVGSGCGSAALASDIVGARTVIANDVDLASLTAIEINNKSNNSGNIHLNNKNLLSNSLDMKMDYILMGDMFYDPDFADLISNWLKNSVDFQTTSLLIGDPGRLSFNNHPMQRFLTKVAEYDLPETCQLENSGFTQACVWECNELLIS